MNLKAVLLKGKRNALSWNNLNLRPALIVQSGGGIEGNTSMYIGRCSPQEIYDRLKLLCERGKGK